jgi:signal peptidase I
MAKPKPKTQLKSQVQEYFEALVSAALLTLFLQAFFLQAFRIPSESMLDTLLVGDFLFVNKLEYGPRIPFTHIRLPGYRKPHPGDVIVFDWPPNPSVQFIKRCVATGGETVEMRHKELYVDGKPRPFKQAHHILSDEHPEGYDARDNYRAPTVPANALFMMGDNRDNSLDSRFWGPVDMGLVQGHAMFIYFSTSGTQWWNGLFNIRFERMFRWIH